MTVREALTGELVYRQRIGTGRRTYSASAVASDDQLYFVSEAGEVTVVETGRRYNQIANNEMGEVVMATPAIAGDRLLMRGVRHLFCLATKPSHTRMNETKSKR